MTNDNTVTIPIGEYFELRKQSEMNAFLMGEMVRYEDRFRKFEDMLLRLEDEIRRMKNGKV